MQKLGEKGDGYEIRISSHELKVINNAIVASLDIVDDDEYHSLIGAYKAEAKDLLSQIDSFLSSKSGGHQ